MKRIAVMFLIVSCFAITLPVLASEVEIVGVNAEKFFDFDKAINLFHTYVEMPQIDI